MGNQDNEPQGNPRIKVTDRRLFDAEGDRREGLDPEHGEPQEADHGAPQDPASEGTPPTGAPQADPTTAGVRYPVTFRALLAPFYLEALIHLGVEAHPETGISSVDLDAARASIDMLTLLEEKTQGNLLPEEARELKDVLYQLRMLYVERSPGNQGS
jgi:hypothetical protein